MMDRGFQMRTFEPKDHDAVWELHNSALESTGAHLGSGPWDNDLHDIPHVYLDQRGEFLVGTLGDRVVAMGALLRTSPSTAQIKRMRVDQSYARRGLGTEVLRELEHRARRKDYSLLHLDTTTLQVAAQRFYEKHGYREVRRGRQGIFDIIFYEKKLERHATNHIE